MGHPQATPRVPPTLRLGRTHQARTGWTGSGRTMDSPAGQTDDARLQIGVLAAAHDAGVLLVVAVVGTQAGVRALQ